MRKINGTDQTNSNLGSICLSGSFTEAYSEPCRTSKMELSVKTLNSLKLLTIFAKRSILDV